MRQNFHVLRHSAMRTLELNLPQELLDRAGVGLVLDASGRPANNTVKHADLLGVIRTRSYAPSNRELVLGLHLRLEPVEG